MSLRSNEMVDPSGDDHPDNPNSLLSRATSSVRGNADTEFAVSLGDISTTVDVPVCQIGGGGNIVGAVLKYVLERKKVQDIGLPKGAQITSVCGRNHDDVVVYAIADKESVDTDTYRFYVYGTGDEFDTEEVTRDMFLGTIAFGSNSIVHVFHKEVEPSDADDVDTETTT